MTENTIEHLQAAAQMGVDVALGRLTYIRAGDSPVAPLLALMAHRDEVAPHLLAVLACLPAEIEQREEERPDDASMYWLHSLALYLAGHFEMPEAWPLIVDFYARDSYTATSVEAVDITPDDLPSILARCYQGQDLAPLKRLIEDADEDDFAPDSLLRSLGGCVLLGKLARAELVAYVEHLLEQALQQDDQYCLFTTFLIDFALGVGETDDEIEAIARQIAALNAAGIVSAHEVSPSVKRGLENQRESLLRELMWDGLVSEIAGWPWFEPGAVPEPRFEDDDDPLDDEDDDNFGDEHDQHTHVGTNTTGDIWGRLGERPFVRAVPKVGRNEPCPCGSGKKYKKCCLDHAA